MNEFESWPVAHEVIASIPFTFGFHPRESVVVTSLSLERDHVTIGASARLDLTALEAPGAEATLDHTCATLTNAGGRAGIVTVHTDREISVWVLDLADLITGRWPFPGHGGYYVHTGGLIHGFAPSGEPRGCQDELELLTTRVAMSQPARSFVEGPESFRLRRTPTGPAAERFTAALGAVDRPDAGRWRELTRRFQDAVSRGGPRPLHVRAGLLLGLEAIPFRDGLLSWVIGGGREPVADFSAVDAGEVLGRPTKPDVDLLDRVYRVLDTVARHAPAGRAVAPVAVAAYLAWYAGDGTRARILAEQALEEDPDNTLAALVRRALSGACPPPWYGSDAA